MVHWWSNCCSSSLRYQNHGNTDNTVNQEFRSASTGVVSNFAVNYFLLEPEAVDELPSLLEDEELEFEVPDDESSDSESVSASPAGMPPQQSNSSLCSIWLRPMRPRHHFLSAGFSTPPSSPTCDRMLPQLQNLDSKETSNLHHEYIGSGITDLPASFLRGIGWHTGCGVTLCIARATARMMWGQ